MKTEGLLFAGCAVFFAGTDVVYWFLSHDPTGTTALALAVGLAFLMGFYLFVTGRRTGMRPEDRPDAEISEAAGEYGFFSPHSWWPLWVALAAAVTAVGLAVGWWLVLIGFVAMMFATYGFVFEYYRGHFKH